MKTSYIINDIINSLFVKMSGKNIQLIDKENNMGPQFSKKGSFEEPTVKKTVLGEINCQPTVDE